MSDFTFPQLNSDQGLDTADGLRNAANAAANVACSLWENFPQSLIPSEVDPFAGGAYMDGLMRGLCTPRGKIPPAPKQPVVGGQCDTLYNLSGTWQQVGGGSGSFDGGNGFGKISNVRTVQAGDGDDGATLLCDQGVGTSNQRLGVVVATRGNANLGATSFNFTPQRVDGLPDNCGQLPPEYPKIDPPPTAYESPQTITNYNVPVTVPVVIIPVTFAPGSIVFRPEVNVDVGGINVNFDLGGVNISLGGGGGGSPQLPGRDTRPSPPTATKPTSPTATVKPVDDGNLRCRLQTLQDGLLNDGYNFTTLNTATVQGAKVTVAEGDLFSVALQVVSRPVNSKVQYSSDGNPNVVYIGWFSWLFSGKPGIRLPVHFDQSVYHSDESPDGFVFQLYAGCTGAAAYTVRTQKAFNDSCPI